MGALADDDIDSNRALLGGRTPAGLPGEDCSIQPPISAHMRIRESAHSAAQQPSDQQQPESDNHQEPWDDENPTDEA